jgi:hypothetical protein
VPLELLNNCKPSQRLSTELNMASNQPNITLRQIKGIASVLSLPVQLTSPVCWYFWKQQVITASVVCLLSRSGLGLFADYIKQGPLLGVCKVVFENEDEQAEQWKELASLVAEDLKLTLDSLTETERYVQTCRCCVLI